MIKMYIAFFQKLILPLSFLIFPIVYLGAQNEKAKISIEPFNDSMRHWYGIKDENNIINPVANQPKYNDSEYTKIADNILLFQRENGGWPKNYDMKAILTTEQIDSVVHTKNILHTTFDNSTTYTHIDYLAQVYTATKIEKYKAACIKGLNFILTAQYPNGGWPQYYPLEEGDYSQRITFNDGAYIGIMSTLKKVLDKEEDFSFIEKDLYNQIYKAYNKGLDCIVKMQINDNNRLTAWCQQHNEVDLSPAWARAFEPPSICNGESAPVVLFLMNIDQPGEEIINAVQSAIKWFEDSKIYNTKVEVVKAPVEKSKWRSTRFDRVVVIDSTAAPIWTRYYELGTNRPLFCDRNSKYLYSLAEVSRERRSGYGWYTYAPQDVLNQYPEWQKKWAPNNNVLKQ